MRWTLAFAALLLGSCGYSEQDLEAAREEGRKEARAQAAAERSQIAAAQDQRDCLAQEADRRSKQLEAMQDARQAVIASLGDVASRGSRGESSASLEWKVAVEALDSRQWRWVETEISSVSDGRETGAVRDRISYQVNPLQLSPDVKLENYSGEVAVLLSCKDESDCIRARGRRLTNLNGRQGFEDIDEGHSSNYWLVGSPNRAQALSQALSTLIAGYANQSEAERCAEPGEAAAYKQ